MKSGHCKSSRAKIIAPFFTKCNLQPARLSKTIINQDLRSWRENGGCLGRSCPAQTPPLCELFQAFGQLIEALLHAGFG